MGVMQSASTMPNNTNTISSECGQCLLTQCLTLIFIIVQLLRVWPRPPCYYSSVVASHSARRTRCDSVNKSFIIHHCSFTIVITTIFVVILTISTKAKPNPLRLQPVLHLQPSLACCRRPCRFLLRFWAGLKAG